MLIVGYLGMVHRRSEAGACGTVRGARSGSLRFLTFALIFRAPEFEICMLSSRTRGMLCAFRWRKYRGLGGIFYFWSKLSEKRQFSVKNTQKSLLSA